MRLWRVLPFGAAIALAVVAGAQQTQNVFDDSTHSGWANWSWATVNFANSTPVHSGATSISVSAGAYQALFLHHSAFDSSLYGSISFWVNGGSSGGQHLNLQALLNDVSQQGVSVGPLVANSWTHVTIPLANLGVANKPNFTGFWLQNTSGSPAPTFYIDDVQVTGAAPPASVTLQIDASFRGAPVNPRHFGINAAVWDSQFPTASTPALLQEMGARALRFPGGSLSDEYHWQTNTTLNNNWTWATSFDAFSQKAVAAGAEMMVTANYGTGTAQEAAAWVTYANVTKHLGVQFWEVGNENYGTWETDANSRPNDPYVYGERFLSYFKLMRLADPSVRVGAVVTTGEDDYVNYTDHPAINPRTGVTHNGWTPVMLTRLKARGVNPGFVVFHRYAQNPGEEDDQSLLLSNDTWAADVAAVKQMVYDYLGPTASRVPVLCTENNSVSSTPGKQSTSLVNALFMADSVASAINSGVHGFYWWDLRNGGGTGNNDPNLYGWRTAADYGVLSPSNEKYPTFYAMKILSRFAEPGSQPLASASSYPLLSSYAIQAADGTLRVMVINKSRFNALNGNLQIAGYTPAADYQTWSYGIPQDTAAQLGVGSTDLTSGTGSDGGTAMSHSFPPYSITVLKFHSTANFGLPVSPPQGSRGGR